MKRFVCLVFLLALLLSACSAREQPSEIHARGIYQLTFKTKNISNDHVGDDWLFTYTHNGRDIRSGYTITQDLETFTFQSISITVREMDKISDIGTGTLTIALCDGGFGKTEITVTENAGAFKGNTAVWEITCEVKLVGKQ